MLKLTKFLRTIPVLRILITEDHLDLAENISDYLGTQGHQSDFAYDGQMAVMLAAENAYDAIIMDINMPKMDGLAATNAIRQSDKPATPILMLTANDTLTDKLAGFDAGADDYIVKPFAMAELYARLQAQVRRINHDYANELTFKQLTLKQNSKTGWVGTQELPLTLASFKILQLLVKQQPELVEKKEIEFQLWGDLKPENDVLRSHIYKVRKILSTYLPNLKISSKHGQGYRLECIADEQ